MNTLRIARLLLLAGAVLAQGCRKEARLTRVQWVVMGTVAAVQCADARAAQDARDTAREVFARMDAALSTWRTDSELSAVNKAAGTGAATAVSPETATVLAAALELCDASGGAFNPLVSPIMRAWGFNGAATALAPPDAATRDAAIALADWRHVALDAAASPPTALLPKQDMRLDLGAIAKGYAVDAAWDALKAAGHTNLLIDLGGELRALGEAAPGRGGWRTGVRNPFDKNVCEAQFLLADGEAVATSGNYERFVEINGVRYAHIMDPRTAMPVSGMASVTVVAPTSMLADGLSTALFVLGVERGAEFLRGYTGCEALWIPDTPESPVMFVTSGLAKRLTPVGGAKLNVRVVGTAIPGSN
ncbi:MAG: FAD:protein FMN transferase [Kiritimatiellaeota bacterium]|nr:FAD:protein FMN transferase [Kiritimatiellota bacterium]